MHGQVPQAASCGAEKQLVLLGLLAHAWISSSVIWLWLWRFSALRFLSQPQPLLGIMENYCAPIQLKVDCGWRRMTTYWCNILEPIPLGFFLQLWTPWRSGTWDRQGCQVQPQRADYLAATVCKRQMATWIVIVKGTVWHLQKGECLQGWAGVYLRSF